MFRAEDTSRANYRSLFEYAAGAEARLAQDRRLAYYEQVLPEMLTRVKGLPLMYQTYSKGWNPADKRPEFIVKRLVPDLDKPIYITDDEGNKIQKGFEKQDLVMETDEDIPAFMTRKGRFKGQHGFNKGFSYLAPIYHVERDQMPFVLVDLDIDRADFSKAAWNRLLTAVTKVYDWFRLNGFDPLINFTGSSFHIWAKDGQVRSYTETKLLLEQLSKEVDLPLAAGAAHIKGQITIDYPQNKYRAPLRFPLSIHGDTGLASIIIPRNQLRKFDPLTKAHPDQVLKQLPNHLAKIDAWFSDLPQTKQSAEEIITAHLETLNEDDQERCMWGDCGVLADELMLRLQAAGHTDAVYEIGLAYIHPFEEYDDKTFIGGHVVVTVDGESYDVLGAGAKQRWVDGPVVQEMLSSHGYIDLGPLLSSHLTVNWVTSPWNEEHKTRSHNFAGKLVDFEAENEYKKKRQKPTPEPGVEGNSKLKPSRRKPPMKVKGSDVYSVQKHRATIRGSHRDIRIGLDGKLLSFVPVGRYEKKDEDGKWQKTDGSRLPKKIGEGVSVIRTEDHPFDYWWFEGEIPKDSYGAGPVSLETHGTRHIIEWKPDEKLKVEFIGGKYAGTYTFERSKKSKDGKIWWMRKSRPVPKDKTDKKTKKAETTDNRYGKLNFNRAFSNWNVTSNNRNYSDATRYIDKLLDEAKYMQGKIILYRALRLANPEDFDPTETGESWTPHKNFAEPYFGYNNYSKGIVKNSNYETYILMALVPVESIDWKESVARALEFGPPSDEKEIVLKRGAPIELINLPMELSFAIDATPEALIRAAEEDDEDWWFTMNTPLGPDEEFGPYDSHDDAMKGIERVMQKVISLQDGHTREFPRAYQGRRGSGFGLRAEDDAGKSEFEQKYRAKVSEYESSNKWREDVEAMDVMGDETYIYALEGRLEYLFPDLELPLSQKDYEELKSANPNLVDEERSIARSISDDMLDRVYNMLFARQGGYENYSVSWSKSHEAEYRDGKILLYREITMNSPEDLDMARAGIYWTPVLQAAEAHWSGGGDAFILRALVDFEDINWTSSWYANLIMPEECEIRLKQGAKIELLPLTRSPSQYGRNLQLGEYVYPEEIVFEIEAPNPNILAVERGTETELLEAMKDLPEEYRRLMGISEVEPQPTRTAFASEEDEVVLYHGTATANVESILQEGLRPSSGWSIDSEQTGVFVAAHPSAATPWARWSAMRALAPDSKGASVGETSKFYQLMARLRMQESDAVTILEIRVPKDNYQDLSCDVADLIDSGILIGDSYEELDVSQWDTCMRNGIDLVYEGRIPPEWISVLPWQAEWADNFWFSRIVDMVSERGEDYFDAEDIDLTVGEAFDKALAEIQADVEAVQPRSKDLSEVTLEDYEKTKQVYQRFMIPAGITGSIVKDEWYYETKPIYLRSDIFKFVDNIEILRFGEWKAKIDAQRSETESDILASDEINYAYHWFMIVQINSIYNWLLSRLGGRDSLLTNSLPPCGDARVWWVMRCPPVELPEIIESQRDATDIQIYRWLATSQDDEPVRRLRNRMRPVDVNYYGGYDSRTDNWGKSGPRDKGLEALSYGPCWSLSPDAYTRTDQWRLAQEDVVHKENEKVGISLKRKLMDEEVNTRTYVIEKSIPASELDWYTTLISSALWLDSPEYEVIPKRGVFLSEEITDSSDFEQEFNKVVAEVTELFKEFSWWSDNQKELYDVSDLHDDAAGRARLRDVELHLARLTRPGSLLWSSGDDSAYDAYPDDLRNPEYIFQDSGIFVDEDGETDGYTDEERGETYEEGDYFTRPFEESPDLDIRLRYTYTLNRLSKLAEQYFSRLESLRTTLKPQFASGEVTLYRAFSLPEGEVPQLRRMTIFPLSMRIGDARRMEDREQRVKYNYESYGAHWSLLSGFEWSDDFPSHYGKPYIMEKQIPYTDVDWFTTLLVMAYGREPEWEVAVNENVFLAENEVKIPLYHVTPLDQVSNILETGLEPRIGPRSERMELEPRIWLFGDQESVDQALMNWLGDEMYGAEWRSGYAVLRIDLPANWFKQRRVEKTFDPYGSERSWEWSTSEKIPGEFIEVIDKWTWSEDELVDFQADFEMSKTMNPVYRKYLHDALNQAELDLATISDDYEYFHLSSDQFVINKDGETFTFTPRVPTYPYGWESGSIEDNFTPRVSLSSSIMGCLDALPDDYDGRWYVYGTKQTDNIVSVRDYFEDCPEEYGRKFFMMTWITSLPQSDQDEIKKYLSPSDIDWDWDDYCSEWGDYSITPVDLPPKYRDMFYGCVPDAMQHDEYWSLEPITMDYLGYITWDSISNWYEVGGPGYTAKIMRNAMRNPEYWLSESVDSNQAIEYPLRLYHGTSVRNWRAEEETSKTVVEAWDKALIKWYKIVDWAKQEREKGIRDVSTTEFQQAIEVYNILYRVSNKISEPHFLGGSMDETVIEQLIQTYASDDLELQKTLIEHYEELHILTIPYVVKSKTMNYFFYYGLIEWIIMMNWRVTSLNSYGGKELDDAISSQFQESTLKAYRWISVGNDGFPSRNMNFNNYADFSYGAHWSLHPEVYTWTTEWEGVQYQKDYLIEKDVPVEDIDWFETLISCLFFLDTPELEIIMKPMTFIAETIDEPHLYLDMDGCFADFAGAITQRVNDVLQVQDVSEITSKSLRRAARKAKELGITSVTERDFDLSLSHEPVKKKVIDRMLYKIASEPGFFYNLEVMNRDVLDEIIASGRPFSFLSAPIGGTKDYSIEDKRAWVRDRLGLDVTVNVVPREEKVAFCQPGDVLIDDHVTTISEWTAAGGHGVLFPQEIDEFLRKPYNGGTTTYQAEEVEKVKQYPIVYKKNATGTLQQWQVLLLPQESGGYLLTTASGKVGGKITQGRGKLIKEGKVNRTALEQAELQADSKFKKKKDEGYFPTKEEAHQNLVLLPMKALDFKKRSHDITYPAVAQRKFDGVRCLAIPQADGSVRLMSRTGKTWTHLHHLQSQIEALNLDSNMVLDGEVYSDTLTFEDATGLVRRQTLKPGDEEKMKQIDYRLYDAILLDNPNATFLDRYVKLAALFPPASSTEGRRMGHLVLTENFPLRNREDLLALHRQFTTDEDFEGVMVRNLHGTYDINKRSKHLQKFKEFQDAEYKIVGYNEASGDWQGTPIWICEMADGRQFNVTPTGDRPSRIEMFNNIEDYMGKLLTVKFFELTADGVPRHGVGLAIRDYE